MERVEKAVQVDQVRYTFLVKTFYLWITIKQKVKIAEGNYTLTFSFSLF